MRLAGFAGSRGEVAGVMYYSVVNEQKGAFSPSLFLHNTKRLKRNTREKIFYEILKLPLVFADNLLGYAVLCRQFRCTGFLFSGEILRKQIRSPCFKFPTERTFGNNSGTLLIGRSYNTVPEATVPSDGGESSASNATMGTGRLCISKSFQNTHLPYVRLPC